MNDRVAVADQTNQMFGIPDGASHPSPGLELFGNPFELQREIPRVGIAIHFGAFR